MSAHDSEDVTQEPSAASVRSLETVTAAVLFALGVTLVVDSLRIGAGWSDDGPQSGYFPFYIGVFLCIASLLNFIRAIRDPQSKHEAFLTRSQAKMVMSLLIPTIVFVIAIGFLGIYFSSALLIGWFMRRMGRFPVPSTVVISLGIPATLFALFEFWFTVPLPKGPIEQMLGLH